MKIQKTIVTCLLLITVIFSFAQNDDLLINKRWGFEKKFLKKAKVGDTLDANIDNYGSSIMFYQNGIVRRNPGINLSDFSGKPKRIDKIEGKWAMKKSELELTTIKGITYLFKVIEINDESIALVLTSEE